MSASSVAIGTLHTLIYYLDLDEEEGDGHSGDEDDSEDEDHGIKTRTLLDSDDDESSSFIAGGWVLMAGMAGLIVTSLWPIRRHLWCVLMLSTSLWPIRGNLRCVLRPARQSRVEWLHVACLDRVWRRVTGTQGARGDA